MRVPCYHTVGYPKTSPETPVAEDAQAVRGLRGISGKFRMRSEGE